MYRIWYKPGNRWAISNAVCGPFDDPIYAQQAINRHATWPSEYEVRKIDAEPIVEERSTRDVRTDVGEGVPGAVGSEHGLGADSTASNKTHPEHYQSLRPEPIDCIEGWDLGPHLANVIKYVSRYGRKHSPMDTTDLRKARNYLTRYITLLETGTGSWDKS